jgi:hypothetical protein
VFLAGFVGLGDKKGCTDLSLNPSRFPLSSHTNSNEHETRDNRRSSTCGTLASSWTSTMTTAAPTVTSRCSNGNSPTSSCHSKHVNNRNTAVSPKWQNTWTSNSNNWATSLDETTPLRLQQRTSSLSLGTTTRGLARNNVPRHGRGVAWRGSSSRRRRRRLVPPRTTTRFITRTNSTWLWRRRWTAALV